LIFEKGFLIRGYFSLENWLFPPFGEKASHLRDLHSAICIFFFLKMLITMTTAVTFPVFAVLLAISSAFVSLLRAVQATLIGRGL
jgi:hypothetical protein